MIEQIVEKGKEKTVVSCDTCGLSFIYQRKLTEEVANAEIERQDWKVEKPAKIWRHICKGCQNPPKWGAY